MSKMNSEESVRCLSEITEFENLSDVRLTIYYMNLFARTRLPVTLDYLVNGWYDYKVIVSGEELAEHSSLLSQLIDAELIPVENERLVNARMYYVFEHEERGEFLAFMVFPSGNDTMLVNGSEFEYDRVFFDVVLPFLPDDAVETIRTYMQHISQE